MLNNAVHKFKADKEDRFVKHVGGWLAPSKENSPIKTYESPDVDSITSDFCISVRPSSTKPSCKKTSKNTNPLVAESKDLVLLT